MNKKLISILTLSVFSTTHAKEVIKDLHLNFSSGFSARYVDGIHVRARTSGLNLNLQGKYKITEQLNFYANTSASLQVGSNSSTFLQEFAPDQQIFLDESFLSYQPADFINIKAGAINQRYLNSPLLVGETAFLGSNINLDINFFEDFKLYLQAQESIPANIQMSERLGSVDEGTPTFSIQTLGLNLPGNVIGIRASFSQFRYTNPSSAVAFQSRYMGNQVEGLGVDNSGFVYGFKGYNATYGLSLFSDETYNFSLDGQYLFNDKAPDNRNTGLWNQITFGFYDYKLRFEYYENESDSSIAYYNTRDLGHNNIQGQSISFEGQLKKNISYVLKATQFKPLTTAINQSKTNLIFANLLKKF